MRVEWLSEARRELRDLVTFYQNRVGDSYAQKFFRTILDAAAQLEQFPESGVLRRENLLVKYGFRSLFVGKYVIIYRIVKGTVYIYNLKDARSNYIYHIFGLRE